MPAADLPALETRLEACLIELERLYEAGFEGVGSPLQGPGTRFLFASYARSLSVRDSVKCRRLIQSPPYRRAWGHRYRLTSSGAWRFESFM